MDKLYHPNKILNEKIVKRGYDFFIDNEIVYFFT